MGHQRWRRCALMHQWQPARRRESGFLLERGPRQTGFAPLFLVVNWSLHLNYANYVPCHVGQRRFMWLNLLAHGKLRLHIRHSYNLLFGNVARNDIDVPLFSSGEVQWNSDFWLSNFLVKLAPLSLRRLNRLPHLRKLLIWPEEPI